MDLHVPDTQGLFSVMPEPRSQLQFFTDFRIVEAGDLPAARIATPFLYGRPPERTDLDRHMDISRADAALVLQAVEKAFVGLSAPRLIIVSDAAGTGKTTIIKRVGHDWVRQGKLTLEVQALARLDPEVAIDCLARLRTPVLLLADGIADYAEQMLPLLQSGKLRGKLVVLGSERLYRQPHVDAALGGVSANVTRLAALSLLERRQLIELYNGFGLVGTRDATLSPDRYAEKLKGDPISVASCRILNDFRPLEAIVQSLWEATDERVRLPYLCVSLAQHCVRAGIRYSIVQMIAGTKSSISDFIADANAPLGMAYSSEQNGHVVPLNAILAGQVLLRASKYEEAILYEAFTSVASRLAPYVNRNAIRSGTPEARLARRLFDADTIVKPLLGGRAEEFYIDAQAAWRWNSRYWEQRALLISETDIDAAVQYARHAVSIEIHPLSLTTLGKLLLIQMEGDPTSREALFSEAFELLSSAIRRESANSRIKIHPFATLFSGAARFLEQGGRLLPRQRSIIDEYIQDAKRMFCHDATFQGHISRLEFLS